jgi:hypothetical protein
MYNLRVLRDFAEASELKADSKQSFWSLPPLPSLGLPSWFYEIQGEQQTLLANLSAQEARSMLP